MDEKFAGDEENTAAGRRKDGDVENAIDAGVQDTWHDSASNLTWMINPASQAMGWDSAKTYCTSLGGGWRLPTIGELRSLIRGCATTQTAGSCGVTDSCLTYSPCRGSSCNGCSGGGPDNGCYWPAPIEGACSWYWSSSPVAVSDNYAWSVGFKYGYVNYNDVNNVNYVRCVR